MNKLSKYTFIGIAISLCFLILFSCKQKKEKQAMPLMDIQVASPVVKDITLTKTYPGYLTSEQTVNLVARVPGVLQQILFKPGSKVKKGALLFIVEPTIYQDNLIKAEASLKSATAQYTYQQSSLERMKEAVKSNAVSQIQVIQTEAAVNQAEADMNTAKAAINDAKTNLSYCYIRAPFDGTIDRNQFDVGNYVGAAGSDVLATVYKDDKMFVYFNIEDNQYIQMVATAGTGGKINSTPISIQIGGDTNGVGQSNGVTYPGILNYLSPNIDVSTGTLSLRADLDNHKGELKTGMYVTITLPYDELNDAVLVREASIGTDQLGKYLYVVNDSNIVNYTPIVLGELIGDSLRQVQKGITKDERYVTTALLKVRNGMKIKPIN